MSGSLFGPGGPAGAPLDPATMGMLGLAGGFASAAMPSRMPVPFGAALGMAGQGMAQGVQQGQQMQSAALQNQAAAMQNRMQAQMMPARLAMLQGLAGGGQSGAPQGAPQPQQGGGGLLGGIGRWLGIGGGQQPQGQPASPQGAAPAAPGAQTNDPGMPADPGSLAMRQLDMQARYALATGDGRTSAALQGRIQQAVQTGMVMGADGTAVQVPGATRLIFAQKQAEAAGTGAGALPANEAQAQFQAGLNQQTYKANAGVDTAQAGPRATAVAGAELPYKAALYAANAATDTAEMKRRPQGWAPGTTVASPDQLQGQNGPPSPLTTPGGAFSSLPAPLQGAFVRAVAQNNIPQSAWPTFTGMLKQESSLNTGQRGGIGSITPGTAQQYGFDYGRLSTDPEYALNASARVYADALKQANGNPAQAAVLYNGGGDPQYLQHVQGRMGIPQPGSAPQAPQQGGGPAVVTGSADAAATQEEGKAEGARLAALPNEIVPPAREAANALQRIQQVRATMAAATAKGLPPGYFSPELAEAAAGAKSLGINLKAVGIDPTAISSQQAAQEALKQINGEMLKRIFPQRITNVDFKAFGSSLPNYGMDPAALNTILNVAQQQAQYDVGRANSLTSYRAQNGTLKGWENQFYQKNGYGPQFFEAMKTADPTMQQQGSSGAPAQSAAPAPPPLPTVVQNGRTVPDHTKLVDGQIYTIPNVGAARFDGKNMGFVPQ